MEGGVVAGLRPGLGALEAWRCWAVGFRVRGFGGWGLGFGVWDLGLGGGGGGGEKAIAQRRSRDFQQTGLGWLDEIHAQGLSSQPSGRPFQQAVAFLLVPSTSIGASIPTGTTFGYLFWFPQRPVLGPLSSQLPAQISWHRSPASLDAENRGTWQRKA